MPAGRVVAGIAATAQVSAFPGASYSWDFIDGGWVGRPLVTFTQTRVSVDNVEAAREDRVGGASP